MDTGKIFLGIALIAFSVAMVINPASAAGCDNSSSVGIGNLHTADCGMIHCSSQDSDSVTHSDIPAICRNSPGNLP